jgi:glucuronate isomerase
VAGVREEAAAVGQHPDEATQQTNLRQLGHPPADEALLGEMVQNICFNNARDYFGIELGA